MEYIIDITVFAAKALIVVVAIGWTIGLLVSAGFRQRGQERGHIKVTDLAECYQETAEMLREQLQPRKWWDRLRRTTKANDEKGKTATDEQSRSTFLIRFKGEEEAEEVESLREEINAILMIAQKEDEVIVSLESPGGVVHGYGHAASQLHRLREAGIRLIVTVDEIAASGGYMMACVADELVAAPFAIVGSIGVIAEIPNIHRLLKRHDVDIEQHTAGEYKRTLTILGENTEKGRRKFQEELKEAHELFKQWVMEHRPQVDIERVATGEYWFGRRALELGLVDKLSTTDDLLLERAKRGRLLEIRYEPPRQPGEGLGKLFHNAAHGVFKLLLRSRRRFPSV